MFSNLPITIDAYR